MRWPNLRSSGNLPHPGVIRAGADELVGAIPTAALLLTTWWLAWHDRGSILASDWLPYAVFGGLLLAALLLSGAAVRPPQAALVGVGGLLLLATWTMLSLRWSPLPALARDEALLVVTYATAFAVPLVSIRGAGSLIAALSWFVAGSAVVTLATGLWLVVTDDPADLYHDGRLFAPIGYWNAQAAFFLLAFWPAIAVSARRSFPLLARAAALAAAASFLGGWLLIQSKGAGVALIASACVFFALTPQRMRALPPSLIVSGLVATAFEPLTEPFRLFHDRGLTPAFEESIHAAGESLLWVTAIAAAAGAGYALVDRRLEVPAHAQRGLRVALVAAALASAGAGVAAYAVSVEHPVGYLSDRWEAFKRPSQSENASTHLVELGSNRYDFWRVAWLEFKRHPVAGVGSRGWSLAYLREGKSDETPRRSHSFELDQLSETGLVGGGLLALALMPPLYLAGRRARGDPLLAGLAGALVYWLVHATGDWLWTAPAVGLPFFVLLGLAAGSDRPYSLPRTAAIGAGVACVIAALLFVPPWLSARFTQHALTERRSDAEVWLRWARRLDPLSIEPLVAEAEIAGSPKTAVAPLRRAVDQQPRAVAPHYLLGVAYLDADRRGDAIRELRIAHRLSPRSDVVQRALERARSTKTAPP